MVDRYTLSGIENALQDFARKHNEGLWALANAIREMKINVVHHHYGPDAGAPSVTVTTGEDRVS